MMRVSGTSWLFLAIGIAIGAATAGAALPSMASKLADSSTLPFHLEHCSDCSGRAYQLDPDDLQPAPGFHKKSQKLLSIFSNMTVNPVNSLVRSGARAGTVIQFQGDVASYTVPDLSNGPIPPGSYYIITIGEHGTGSRFQSLYLPDPDPDPSPYWVVTCSKASFDPAKGICTPTPH